MLFRSLYRLPDVLEGDIGELTEALSAADQAERLVAAGASEAPGS